MNREDGRTPEQMRTIEIKAGIIPNANGSALFRFGRTTAIAAVYGPRSLHPKHLQDANKAVLRCYYSMLPFSTTERVRPGPSRRSTEISLVTKQSLEPALFLEEFPRAAIDVYINIVQAEAGTRTAGINAAAVALADAGIPMRDLVASVASGQIDGTPCLDLKGKEEDVTDCDLPVAYMPRLKKISLLQMDGNMSVADTKKALELAIKGCEDIYELQKKALKERWRNPLC